MPELAPRRHGLCRQARPCLNRPLPRWTRLFLLLLFLLLPTCARPTPTSTVSEPAARAHGRLLIIGGGLRDDNTAVWNAFADAAGLAPHIGIIPTASGLPEAGASTALDIRTRLPHAVVDVIDLREDSAHLAHDPAVVDRIAACDTLWFTGGDQSRITAVFRPPDGDTPAYEAARTVLENGGLIAGTSAGAAMMSDPMITGGRSDRALVHAFGTPPVDDPGDADPRGVGIGRGMGFFPYGLTDQHFLRRARLGRLIAALHETRRPRGYGVADDRAILVDLATHTIRPIGQDALLLVDVSQSTRRPGASINNVHLSLLSGGDEVDGRTGQVRRGARGSGDQAAALRELATDPFAPDAVRHAIHAAREAPRDLLRLTSEETSIGFMFSAAVTAVPVRLDITVAGATHKRP